MKQICLIGDQVCLVVEETLALIVIYLIKLFELWVRYTKVFFFVGKEDSYRIAQKYERKYMQLFKESVFREVVHVSSLDQMLSLQAEYVLTIYSALLMYVIFAVQQGTSKWYSQYATRNIIKN